MDGVSWLLTVLKACMLALKIRHSLNLEFVMNGNEANHLCLYNITSSSIAKNNVSIIISLEMQVCSNLGREKSLCFLYSFCTLLI